MIRLTEIKLPLGHAESALPALLARTLGVESEAMVSWNIHKRSFDARKAQILVVYIVDIAVNGAQEEDALLAQHASNPHIFAAPDMRYQLPYPISQVLPPTMQSTFATDAESAPRPVVIGFGPCGIFAALLLAQMGFKPIVLERGRPVRQRTQDTWGLWRKGQLHPESNVQFGEGGAGTFSDGKLWSQIKDPRHLGRKVMQEFVKAGAPADILVDAHPHIGTFKLVKVVENMRAQIIALGGEIRFQQRVTDLHMEPGLTDGLLHIRYLTVLDQREAEPTGESATSVDSQPKTYHLRADHVVLALGHSARDTFAMLHARGVAMQAKPFSIGFRIEHPQGLIDRARWGRHAGHPALGAAEYKLVHHASNNRSVYSFCMCPGGTVVAATSEPGRVVTNGMSQYSRNERNANAGIVVGIDPARDYPDGVLAGIALQRRLESSAFLLGGSNYQAPGQLVGDFLAGRPSTTLGQVEPSYKPGLALGDLSKALPDFAIAAIREALPVFGQKITGFDRHDAVLTGVETRTSSPVKISRGDDFQNEAVRGLYPAGEGASYAGGILSAGVDGIRVAEAVARSLVTAYRPYKNVSTTSHHTPASSSMSAFSLVPP